MLRPHTDRLERMLYRTGCLVIFSTTSWPSSSRLRWPTRTRMEPPHTP
ncbi:unnamed protein product [Ascophyllum nodosum]